MQVRSPHRDQARRRNSLPSQVRSMLRRASQPTMLVERRARAVNQGNSNLNHKRSRPKLLAQQRPRLHLLPLHNRPQAPRRNPSKSSLELSSTHTHPQSTQPSRLQQPPVYHQLVHQLKFAHRKRQLQLLVRPGRSPTKPPSALQTSAARSQAPFQDQHRSRALRKVQLALL